MNCKLCQENLEAYRRSELADDMKTQVELHLTGCSECAAILKIEAFADRIISDEKETVPAHLTTESIMTRIRETVAQKDSTGLKSNGIIRSMVIAGSIAAALFAGILIGNLYQPSTDGIGRPEELRMMNDSDIEVITSLSNE